MVRSPWLHHPDQLNQPQSPETTQEEALLTEGSSANRTPRKQSAKQQKLPSKLQPCRSSQSSDGAVQQTNTASLEGQGRFEDLWKEAQKTIASLS